MVQFKVLFRHSPGQAKNIHKSYQDIQCPNRDSNQVHLEYKIEALQLEPTGPVFQAYMEVRQYVTQRKPHRVSETEF
jgi:hypothetical protein